MRSAAPDYDLVVECDGSTKKTNPGPSGWGFVALSPFMSVIYEDAGLVPHECSSNEAEYYALLNALGFAKDLGYVRRIEVRADSKTMVRQLQYQNRFAKSEALNLLADKVQSMIGGFDVVDLLWVPRKWNQHANALANAAFLNEKKQAAIRRINRSDFEMMPEWHKNNELELWEDD